MSEPRHATSNSAEPDYVMPDNLFGWLNAHARRKVYVKTNDGTEWVGVIGVDAPGILRLHHGVSGMIPDSRIYESAIVGVAEAQ